MPRPKREISEATLGKLIKEGRGQGEGQNYQPFIKVQDFSSCGQANRDFGHTTQRQHDYFNKLEYQCYVVFDYAGLHDIQEQYLIPFEKSVEISNQCGIPHPIDSTTKKLEPMTTDFRLTIPRPVGSTIAARAVRRSSKLLVPREVEILELERRCWACDGIDWGIITELDLDPILIKNLKWSYKFRSLKSLCPLPEDMVYRVSNVLTEMVLAGNSSLSEIALECDDRLGLEAGRSLKVARYLIATRQWEIDIFHLIKTVEKLSLISVALCAQERRKTGT
jgi:hypothetical protein